MIKCKTCGKTLKTKNVGKDDSGNFYCFSCTGVDGRKVQRNSIIDIAKRVALKQVGGPIDISGLKKKEREIRKMARERRKQIRKSDMSKEEKQQAKKELRADIKQSREQATGEAWGKVKGIVSSIPLPQTQAIAGIMGQVDAVTNPLHFKTKAQAEKEAKLWRKRGFKVNVIKSNKKGFKWSIRSHGLTLKNPVDWDAVGKRVDLAYRVIGHPMAREKPVEEGKHFITLAYTDWADMFVPTIVKWINGEIDDFTDYGDSFTNRSKARKSYQDFISEIRRGEWREKYGLDTDSGSQYHKLIKEGLSDIDAQFLVYVSRGLIFGKSTRENPLSYNEFPEKQLINPTKADAQKEAQAYRETGYRARVMRVGGGDWDVFKDGISLVSRKKKAPSKAIGKKRKKRGKKTKDKKKSGTKGKKTSTGVQKWIERVKAHVEKTGMSYKEAMVDLKGTKSGRKKKGKSRKRTKAKAKPREGKLRLSDIPAIVKNIMPKHQQRAIVGSEEHWSILGDLGKRAKEIPKLYSQDDKGKQATVYLHYFFGGSDWFITEWDGKDDYFGYVILNGDYQNSEYGYVSRVELSENNRIELDFFWRKKTLQKALDGVDKEYFGVKPKKKPKKKSKAKTKPKKAKAKPKFKHKKIESFIQKSGTWFDIEEGDDEHILLSTRKHGSVSREEPGRQDITEAVRLKQEITNKFSGVVITTDIVDEWVNIWIAPKKTKVMTKPKAKVKPKAKKKVKAKSRKAKSKVKSKKPKKKPRIREPMKVGEQVAKKKTLSEDKLASMITDALKSML